MFHGKLAELRFEENDADPRKGALVGSTASVAGKSTEGVLGENADTIAGAPVAAQKQKQPVGTVNATAGGAAPWRGVTAPQTDANVAMTAPQVGSEDTVMGGTDETTSFGVQSQPHATAVRG